MGVTENPLSKNKTLPKPAPQPVQNGSTLAEQKGRAVNIWKITHRPISTSQKQKGS